MRAFLHAERGDLDTASYVKGSNTEAGDEFGSAVALSTDGRIMAIGAHNEDGSSKGIGGNQADNSGG